MSGINPSNTINYQRQFDQLNQAVRSAQNEVDTLQFQNQDTVNAYRNAKDAVQRTLDWAKGEGLTDMSGKPLQFNTLEEFHKLCEKGGIKDKNGNVVNGGNGFIYTSPPIQAQLNALKAAEAKYNEVMGPAIDKLNAAQNLLNSIGASLQENVDALEQMRKLLESGDIEGAVMLLQNTRAKSLEGQLTTEIKAMQLRNAQVKDLNLRLAQENEKLAKMDPEKKDEASVKARAAQQTVVSNLKTEIDSLNSESQTQMIRVQGLVNKRNEAFDMLTNLLQKFQKTIDNIVGNLR